MRSLARLILWHTAHAYGELRWRMHGGACPGYYWALRVCSNVCLRDWYGRPTNGRTFNYVGRPRW